jgi:antitoxin VapB
MPFHVRDKETDALVRELAKRRRIGLTEAVKLAVGNELKREAAQEPLWERLKKIADSVAQYEDTGTKADKAFFDRLSGE